MWRGPEPKLGLAGLATTDKTGCSPKSSLRQDQPPGMQTTYPATARKGDAADSRASHYPPLCFYYMSLSVPREQELIKYFRDGSDDWQARYRYPGDLIGRLWQPRDQLRVKSGASEISRREASGSEDIRVTKEEQEDEEPTIEEEDGRKTEPTGAGVPRRRLGDSWPGEPAPTPPRFRRSVASPVTPVTLPPSAVLPVTVPPAAVTAAAAPPVIVPPAEALPVTVPPIKVLQSAVPPAAVHPAAVPPVTVLPAAVPPVTVTPETVNPAAALPVTVAPAAIAPAAVTPVTVSPAEVLAAAVL
ncbi:hypothetical protein NDU88_011152 [Pleurodeles waltl]|uniref:Uncharacterized protein n=1 Tax=Pleurodeles waltl TaxID=8319 RepID=A0AAV7S4K6_PLEWA|nr:hypothetical protein NDU88_011152 [Pleurodeles waltl]